MLRADLLQARREVGGHGDEAALALDRLEHDARDGRRVDLALKAPAARRSRPRADPAVLVRRGRAVDLGRERARSRACTATTLLVSDMVSSVRPWNARSKAITAGRPVAARAILTAFSTASAPEFTSTLL